MRILITGSRTWNDIACVENAIVDAAGLAVSDRRREIILVSGACPTGADRQAEQFAEDIGIRVELHPADWDRYGLRAGYVRNQEMVDLGADVCLAFIRKSSRGASMTAQMAEKAGIPTFRFEVNE